MTCQVCAYADEHGAWPPEHRGTLDRLRDWVNPLVCVCPNPDVDGIGMCRSCYRKPAELLRVPS